jgi:predicted acetyltransferase
MEIRVPLPAEHEAFMQAMGATFSFEPSPFYTELLDSLIGPDRLLAAFDGDSLVATYGAFPLEMQVPGGSVRTSGVTIVTVLPTHRRQGILTEFMKRDLAAAKDRGELVASLWASEPAIYGRYGFGPAAYEIGWELAKASAIMHDAPDVRGAVRFLDETEAKRSLPAIYESALEGVPGSNSRTAQWWHTRFIADDPERRQGRPARRIALLERDGEGVAYAIYRTKAVGMNSELSLVELVGIDASAEKAMWQYLFEVDLTEVIKAGLRPSHDPLHGWLVNPRAMKPKAVDDSIWIKLVDVPAALAARTYRAPGTIIFEMVDEYCPWNSGTWVLSVSEDGTGQCTSTEASPDVTVTPGGLGSLYLGSHSAFAMASAGQATGTKAAIAKMDLMFGWHIAAWCPEIF